MFCTKCRKVEWSLQYNSIKYRALSTSAGSFGFGRYKFPLKKRSDFFVIYRVCYGFGGNPVKDIKSLKDKLGQKPGLVDSKLDSQLKGCGFESCLILH